MSTLSERVLCTIIFSEAPTGTARDYPPDSAPAGDAV